MRQVCGQWVCRMPSGVLCVVPMLSRWGQWVQVRPGGMVTLHLRDGLRTLVVWVHDGVRCRYTPKQWRVSDEDDHV